MSIPTITTTTSGTGTVWVSSGTEEIASSIDWGAQSAGAVQPPVSECSIAGIKYAHYEPPPSAWIRFWQKRLLGITWRDLRPERAMQELKGLK